MQVRHKWHHLYHKGHNLMKDKIMYLKWPNTKHLQNLTSPLNCSTNLSLFQKIRPDLSQITGKKKKKKKHTINQVIWVIWLTNKLTYMKMNSYEKVTTLNQLNCSKWTLVKKWFDSESTQKQEVNSTQLRQELNCLAHLQEVNQTCVSGCKLSQTTELEI